MGWPATIQMIIVSTIIVAGGFTWLTIAGRRVDRELAKIKAEYERKT